MKGIFWLGCAVFVAATCQGEEPVAFDRLTQHAEPKPLASEAVTTDWRRFLGPTDDAHSTETPLLKDLQQASLLWEVAMGEGYAGVAVDGQRVLLFHAQDGEERLECVHAETGRRFWSQAYPVEYRDRYGFAGGPRATPVVSGQVVVTLGVTSELRAWSLATGELLWQRDLRKEFHVPQDFFGHGTTPLVVDGRVMVNVGGKSGPVPEGASKRERSEVLASKGVSVAAFDLESGATIWELEHEWGASYASPIVTTLHGEAKLLVFAGGESDPPTGGLMCIDPGSGALHSSFPWRADDYISATASSPTVVPDRNRVLITTCYPKGRPLGAALVEFDETFQPREVWNSPGLGVHWMTPIYHEGHFYAIDGERENNSRLVCVDAETGQERWSEELFWQDDELARRMGRDGGVQLGILRASLLWVDGAFLCLGELGTLQWLDLSPSGCEVRSQKQLFYAANCWSLPALSRGLLYVRQHADDLAPNGDSGPRVVCYDLRGG